MTAYIDPRSKLMGHLDRLADLKAGGRPAPVNVEIDLSNRCSLGCSWCHFAYTHTRGPLANKREKPPGAVAGGDLMDVRLAREILLQLAAAGVRSVSWTGGGEPTLHPNFAAVIDWAQGCGLEQGIYTNGCHIAPERASVMRRALTWAYVSLDECDRESYHASKGVDAFERACAGVRNLAAADGNATVGVGFLLHRDNWMRAADMIALGRELGAQYVQFRPTILYDQAAPERVTEDTAWLHQCIRLLGKLDAPDVLCDVDRFRMYRDWQGHPYQTCWWSGLSTVITPNGKVWRCVNKRERAGAELGDLSRESFADVWARSGGPCVVDGDCRAMCRGHLSNLELTEIMADRPHAAFI